MRLSLDVLAVLGFFCKWRGSAGVSVCWPPTNQLTVDGAPLPFSAVTLVGVQPWFQPNRRCGCQGPCASDQSERHNDYIRVSHTLSKKYDAAVQLGFFCKWRFAGSAGIVLSTTKSTDMGRCCSSVFCCDSGRGAALVATKSEMRVLRTLRKRSK
jgi:hypothetical protein